MNRDEILDKVREVLVDALAVDDDEVTPTATLRGDLGAESIDMLDITFKLEQEFDFKVAEGEMIPQNALQDPEFVQKGAITDKGIAELKTRMPHFDFDKLGSQPTVETLMNAFTVDTLVNFVERKLAAAA
ncbi:MAG: phosphopantetheine-binding protein [Planctomycetota bacterium]